MAHNLRDAFVLAACGHAHLQRAEFAARSFQRFTDCNVIIVATRCRSTSNRRNIIYADCPDHLNDIQASRYLKTGIYRFLPDDRRYCYVDNDVFAVSPRAQGIFALRNGPVAFAGDPGKTVANFSRYATRGLTLSEAIALRFGGLQVDPSWPIWNGGVYIFDKSSHPFLGTWHDFTNAIFSDPLWKDRDQGTLIAAAWKHGLQDLPLLPAEFNWLHKLQRGLCPHSKGFRTKRGAEVALLHFPVTYGETKYQSWNTLLNLLNSDDAESQALHTNEAKDNGTRTDVPLVHTSSDTKKIEIGWEGRWEPQIAHALSRQLNRHGYLADVRRMTAIESRLGRFQLNHGIYIRRTSGCEYALIDFKDSVGAAHNRVVREIAWDPDCRLILKGQFRTGLYDEVLYTKVKPYTYFAGDPSLLDRLAPSLRQTTRSCDKLYFRGAKYGSRKKILDDLGDLLMPTKARLSIQDYYIEASQSRIGLSMPGFGNVCHREIEYFGMGVPVIMPRLKNSFYDPLLPNEHYISVDIDPSKQRARDVAQAIRATYERVMDDAALLKSVSINAQAWYDRNVALCSSIPLTLKLLSLSELAI